MRNTIRTLSIRAWDALRNSEYAEPRLIDAQGRRFGRRRLMFWRTAEGFHDDEPETLTVFQPFESEAPIVRKATWKRSVDQRSHHRLLDGRASDDLNSQCPTIVVRDERIDSTGFEDILDQATSLRISIVWPWPKDKESLTTDVGMVGFEFFDLAEPQASLRCAWSVDLPPEWEPIRQWYRRMYDFLQEHFSEQ